MMKESNIHLSRLLVWVLIIIANLPVKADMQKIDDTHYRICVMDCDVLWTATCNDNYSIDMVNGITDQSYRDLWIIEYNKMYKTQTNVRGAYVFSPCPDPATSYNFKHTYWRWGDVSETVKEKRVVYYYIEVVAPTGISCSTEAPKKMILGEQASFSCKLTGDFPNFNYYVGGKFLYQYQSSDENIISVKQESIKTRYKNSITQNITAKGLGKATITVKAWAINEDVEYSGSYYIGDISFDIEVVDNLDATGISLSKTEILTHVGETATIEANLTPVDARSTVSWSSSDNNIATVVNGEITGKGSGNAVIEATTSNGLSARCYVTVLGDEDYHHIKIGDVYYDLNRRDLTATVVHKIDFEEENIYFGKEKCNYIQGDVVIPSSINWYDKEFKVTEIGERAFYECDIRSVQLPNTLTSIDGTAFYKTLLTNIEIPESVASIGEGCFMYCPLENVSLPVNLKKIPDGCFYGTSSLRDIELPSTIEEIGDVAFEQSGIESIFIPSTTKSIGSGVFSSCKNLDAIYVDSDNPYYKVYNNCLYSHDLKIFKCAPGSLNEIVFADETEEVDCMASCDNNNLVNLILSDNITVIRNGAFADCKNLKEIIFNRSLKVIEGASFSDCGSLINLNLPESLLEIEDYAFSWCRNIKSISFGSKLKIIGEAAFDWVNPDKIYIKAVMPPTINDDTFSEYDATLIVPKGRRQAYSKATGWSKFKVITDEDEAGVEEIIVDGDCIIEVYDLNGIFISDTIENLTPGNYIIRQGNVVEKIVVK